MYHKALNESLDQTPVDLQTLDLNAETVSGSNGILKTEADADAHEIDAQSQDSETTSSLTNDTPPTVKSTVKDSTPSLTAALAKEDLSLLSDGLKELRTELEEKERVLKARRNSREIKPKRRFSHEPTGSSPDRLQRRFSHEPSGSSPDSQEVDPQARSPGLKRRSTLEEARFNHRTAKEQATKRVLGTEPSEASLTTPSSDQDGSLDKGDSVSAQASAQKSSEKEKVENTSSHECLASVPNVESVEPKDAEETVLEPSDSARSYVVDTELNSIVPLPEVPATPSKGGSCTLDGPTTYPPSPEQPSPASVAYPPSPENPSPASIAYPPSPPLAEGTQGLWPSNLKTEGSTKQTEAQLSPTADKPPERRRSVQFKEDAEIREVICEPETHSPIEDPRELFQLAESLCEQQRFADAIPLFHGVLEALQSSPQPALRAVEAEVWAHLGVAMQSLDRVEDAVASYKRAVALDPTLHVCLANLATLHMYLDDEESARKEINEALLLDPGNATYVNIAQGMQHAPA